MKNGFLLLCTTLLLAIASPGYSAFSPTVKVLVLGAKEAPKKEMPAPPSVPFSALQTGSKVQKHQRLGFWKRLKMRLLCVLLPDGKNDKQLLAFVMGLIGGIFGLHRFVLGYNHQGFVYLLVTLLGAFILLFGAFFALLGGPAVFYAFLRPTLFLIGALGIWLIIDLIRIAAGTLRPKSEL